MKETRAQGSLLRQSSKNDRRVIRTRRSIRKAFFELLSEKDVDKITVAELARLADIDRKTFYLHYASIEDLVEEETRTVVERLTKVIVSENRTVDNPFNLRALFTELIALSDSSPQAYRRALKTMSTDQLAKQLCEPVCQTLFETYNITADDDCRACRYMVLFCLSGTLSAFSLYLEEDDTPTAEEILEIADNATALINKGISDQ